jgi:tryptophan halogenase
MIRQLVIVGGGTAGWLTAAYLARTLASTTPGGIDIVLVESPEIPTVGFDEGTLPSIQRTLRGIGLHEADFMRDSSATFKQGIHFVNWRYNPGSSGRNDYFHPFQSAHRRPGGLDLLPYWLLGLTPGVQLDEAATVQKRVAERALAPKCGGEEDFAGPLSYAFHFDAASFARTLRSAAIQQGVRHLTDTVQGVEIDAAGTIISLETREHGRVTGDLYVDCSGFRAQLIGRTLGMPLKSCLSTLFCDRAVLMQVPYSRADAPLASSTISTAQEAGWTWDIGLDSRRGVGYVYSSSHSSDERAEQILRRYIGPGCKGRSPRLLRFEAGYRETSWYGNCVAVGLAGGFFEPLEATEIGFVQAAASLLAQLFPWNREFERAARQFNRIMRQRYERVLDFLKMHYCLTARTDTAFWRDNTLPRTIPASLQERLEAWRYRVPEELDFDSNVETFAPPSWQFVLYGMGYDTDLGAQAAIYPHFEQAGREFAAIRVDAERITRELPAHRDLIQQIYRLPKAG